MEPQYTERRYFSSIKKYTQALIESFSGVKYWTFESKGKNRGKEKEFPVPITFANYEKALNIEDIPEEALERGHHNILPRIVIAFEGLSKAPERQTQKYQKFSNFNNPGGAGQHQRSHKDVDFSWNSQSYDFHFTLLVQARGLTIASMITEEIITKFNPSLNLQIKEFPIFDELTETQILIEDPQFEILEDQDPEATDIVNVSFGLTVRGNVYSPISMTGRIEQVKIITQIWDTFIEESNITMYYSGEPGADGIIKPETEIMRHFDATIPWTEDVEGSEYEVITKRPDYSKPVLKTPKD